ncbi:hypothetical protein V6N13_061880 [Hibiscus sabdariffa]
MSTKRVRSRLYVRTGSGSGLTDLLGSMAWAEIRGLGSEASWPNAQTSDLLDQIGRRLTTVADVRQERHVLPTPSHPWPKNIPKFNTSPT